MSDIDPKTGQLWELPDLGPPYNRLRDWALVDNRRNGIERSWFAIGAKQIGIQDMQFLTLHMIRDCHHPNDREALARLVLGRGTQADRERPSMQPWLDENGHVFPEFADEVMPWAKILDELGEVDVSDAEYAARMRVQLAHAREQLAAARTDEDRLETRVRFFRAWPQMLKRLNELPEDFRVPMVDIQTRIEDDGAAHVVITVPRGTISRGGPT